MQNTLDDRMFGACGMFCGSVDFFPDLCIIRFVLPFFDHKRHRGIVMRYSERQGDRFLMGACFWGSLHPLGRLGETQATPNAPAGRRGGHPRSALGYPTGAYRVSPVLSLGAAARKTERGDRKERFRLFKPCAWITIVFPIHTYHGRD